MKQPTQKQIDAEIALLKEQKPRVRQYTAFGDDNHASIEAQIETLEKQYDMAQIDDKLDEEEWTNHQHEGARDAVDWLNGDSQYGPPSKGWKSLIK